MFQKFLLISFHILMGLFATVALCSCKEDSVTVYRVPKEAPKPLAEAKDSTSGGGMTVLPGMAETAAQFETPEWVAPAGWQPQPLGQIRKGSWRIEGISGQAADVSVSVFPGDVGGILANVNRWREQIGLQPVTEGNLETTQVSIGERSGQLIVLEGPAPEEGQAYPQSILGCLVSVEGSTWIFKMMGDAPLIAEQGQVFDAFLQTVRFP